MDPNERLTGIAQMAPASMGGLPMQDPNAPPMQDPSAGMGVMGAPPPPEMMPPEMMASEPQEMQEGESTMLAEAVMERTDGDIEAAIVILNEATDKLMASADQSNQDPMMANMGGPMYMNMGGSVDYKMGGGPLYRENGGTMSDADLLRQMIMSSLEGRTMSDNDMSGRTMSDADQSGRTMSDMDGSGRTLSLNDLKRYITS